MQSSWLIFADAIDGFLDWLVPVAFFVIFFLSVTSSAKKKAKEAQRRQYPSAAPRPAPPRYPRADDEDEMIEMLEREEQVAEAIPIEEDDAELEVPAAKMAVRTTDDEDEGESHVTPMGEPYHSRLVDETAPSIEHSAEHIGADMPEGTVAPPPPGATVKAGTNIAIRRVSVGNAALPHLKLKRGRTALRSALVLREVLSRPRAYDI